MTPLPSDHDREIARLARYREFAARVKDDAWGLEADGGEMRVVCRRSTGERATVCTIHPDALAVEFEIIAAATEILAFFLMLQDRAVAKVRELQGNGKRQEERARKSQPANQAAMLCEKVSFHRFLETKGPGSPVPDKRAADTRMKALLSISSKTQLNDDRTALARFRSLRADYDAWMRGAS